MPNKIFEEIVYEKIEIFKNSFSNISRNVFKGKNGETIFHPGEFGTYRENICKEFLRLFTPSPFGIGSGFVINDVGHVSNQCEIIIFDRENTPLIESNEKMRFFPVETVVGVGEIKSNLKKEDFIDSLNRLAFIKSMREKISLPTIIKSIALLKNE